MGLDRVRWISVRGALAALALGCLSLVSQAGAEEKALHGIALVVGQSDYQNLGRLTNPANDAKAINTLLTNLGFEVDLVANADRKKLTKALDRFVEDAADADVALIYYSGHGIEAGGENFLVPVDADVSALDRAGDTLVPVSKVLAKLQASVPVTIVLLDACRSNPFPAGATIKVDGNSAPAEIAPSGLGTPRGAVALGGGDQSGNGQGLGAVIGFAAAPGHVALDGDANGNSPYAAALLKHFAAPGFDFSDVMTMVTEEVYLETGAKQTPWTNASLRRLLYFGGTAENDGDVDETAIRGERRKLLLTISTLGDVERSQVVATAKGDGVPMDALFAMLKAIGADTPKDPDQLAKLLEQQSLRLKTLLDDRAALENPDPEIARLAALANKAVSEGALDVAIDYRERAKKRVVSLSSTVDQAEKELARKHVEFAAVFAASAETYALAGNAERAAEDFGKAYDEVAKWDDALAVKYKLAQAQAFSDLGYFRADDAANRNAIDAYQDAARLAASRQELGRMGQVPGRAGHGVVERRSAFVGDDDARPGGRTAPGGDRLARAGREARAGRRPQGRPCRGPAYARQPQDRHRRAAGRRARRARGARGEDAGRGAERLGAAAEPPRLGPLSARPARAVERALRAGGGRLPGFARGVDGRIQSARMGECPEQSRHRRRPARRA